MYDYLVPFLDPASLSSAVVVNAGVYNDMAVRWWRLWLQRACLALEEIRLHRHMQDRRSTAKQWHLHFPRPTVEWWKSNGIVHLFHAHARLHAEIVPPPGPRPAALEGGRCARKRWRRCLNRRVAPGQIYDVCDARGFWSGAVVLRVRHCRMADVPLSRVSVRRDPDAQPPPQVHPKELRVFVLFRFFGWSSLLYNEWVPTGPRVMPFGLHSLQWTARRRPLRPQQYCLVHRYQLLCAMDGRGQGQPSSSSCLSGYCVADVINVFRPQVGDRSIVQVSFRVDQDMHAPCTCEVDSTCLRHPMGRHSRSYLLHMREDALLPLNDMTAIVFLGKCFAEDEPYMGWDLPVEYRQMLESARRHAAVCARKKSPPSVPEPAPHLTVHQQRLEHMGAQTLPWTRPLPLRI